MLKELKSKMKLILVDIQLVFQAWNKNQINASLIVQVLDASLPLLGQLNPLD